MGTQNKQMPRPAVGGPMMGGMGGPVPQRPQTNAAYQGGSLGAVTPRFAPGGQPSGAKSQLMPSPQQGMQPPGGMGAGMKGRRQMPQMQSPGMSVPGAPTYPA